MTRLERPPGTGMAGPTERPGFGWRALTARLRKRRRLGRARRAPGL